MTFTTIIAADAEHERELDHAIHTWRKFLPEIWQNPLILIGDSRWGVDNRWHDIKHRTFADHPHVMPLDACGLWQDEIGQFDASIISQREKMLSAIVWASRHVKTEYYFKCDTDCIARSAGKWFEPEWFDGQNKAIASPWGYTKPGWWYDQLDRWSESNDLFKHHTAPHREQSGEVARSRRLISYCYWGHVAWQNQILDSNLGKRLPVPSHDTLLSYCLARTGEPYLRVNMRKNYNFAHIAGGANKIALAVKGVLGDQ